MPVKYISVTPIVDLFVPATRSFGDIAIIGSSLTSTHGPKKTPVAITNPLSVSLQSPLALTTSAATASGNMTLTFGAVPSTIVPGMTISHATSVGVIPTGSFVKSTTATTVVMSQGAAGAGVGSGDTIRIGWLNGAPVDDPGWFAGDVAEAVKLAFAQSPGPTTVWAIASDPDDGTDALAKALAAAAKINVQIVVLANTPLAGTAAAPVGLDAIKALATHCNTVSGGDGKERIGVAMLGTGITDPKLVSKAIAQNRMTLVAHHSTQDAAAAYAGVIAGYQPHISTLLKPITLDMDEVFSDDEIDAFNAARINWVTSTPLLPGAGFYMGESYTLGVDQPYVDMVRTIDEISFALKASLIRTIGVMRVTRSGLRALVSQMSAVLQPLQDDAVIDSYLIYFPLLTLLDKAPASLSAVELQEIHNAQATRTVPSIVTVEYAGAIHRLNITLKFE